MPAVPVLPLGMYVRRTAWEWYCCVAAQSQLPEQIDMSPRLTVDSSRASSSVLSHSFSGYGQLNMTDQAVKFAKPLCQVSSASLLMFKFT